MTDYEPVFQAGAFHIELIDEAWGIYDSFHNKVFLYFAEQQEAIDAARSLHEASETSVGALDAEYARLLPLARASLDAVA